jgi:hypothetical protein
MTLVQQFGYVDWQGTADFIKFCDSLFDSLNSKFRAMKPLNRPLRANSAHVAFWADAKQKLGRLKFYKNGVQVSPPPSVRNFIVTIPNIEQLWKTMQELGLKNPQTRSLNQDPLENLFGNIRSLCGDSTRPTQLQFLGAYKACQINNFLIKPDGTN